MKNKFLISILLSLLILSSFVIAEENNEYSMNASVYSQKSEVSPCGIATFDVIITNLGQESDTFYLDVSGVPKEWYTLTHDSVTLNPEESKTIYLFITADCYSKEAEYNITVSILGKSDTSVDAILKVKPDRILEIKTPEKLSGCLCEDSSSKAIVENKGKYEENVILSMNLDSENYALSENEFTLNSGESKEVELSIKAACDNTPVTEPLELEAKSQNSYARSTKTIQIERLNCHDFSLSYDNEINVCSGEPTVLEIEIENTGTKEDVFTVSIDEMDYSEAVSIKPGASEKISTVLTIQEEKETGIEFLLKSSYKSEIGSLKIISEKCYGVDIQPEANEIKIESGKGILLKAKIKNLGIKQDSFKIYSDVSWASIRPKTIALEGNETKEAFAYYSPEFGALGVYETMLVAESEKSKDTETIKINVLKEVEEATTTISEISTTTTEKMADTSGPNLLQNKSIKALVIAVIISLIIFSVLYFFVMKGD